MKALRIVLISAALLTASVFSVPAQVRIADAGEAGRKELQVSVPIPPARFSGAVETGAGFFLKDKSGEILDVDVVIGVKTRDRFFLGIGAGYARRFLLNEQYDPDAVHSPHPAWDWDFTRPRILKAHQYSLFLNARRYIGEGRFKPLIDGRAGLAVGGSNTLGGYFCSVGAGCRYDLAGRTGVSLRAYYEAMGGFSADDVYDSMEGWFHTLGLRLAYEF